MPRSVRATVTFMFCIGWILAGQTFAQDQAMEQAITAYEAGDFETAGHLWEPLANEGNAQAQYALAVLFHKGQGRPADFGKALEWYHRAAEQDHVNSLFNLGVAYWEGRSVDRDLVRAVKWWRRAAELEYGAAQHNLATAYYLGQGVDKDIAHSIKWFQKAVANGYQRAEKALTVIQNKFPEMFVEVEPAAPTSVAESPQPAHDEMQARPAAAAPDLESMDRERIEPATDTNDQTAPSGEAIRSTAVQTARVPPATASVTTQSEDTARTPASPAESSGTLQSLAGLAGPQGAKVYPFHRESLPVVDELSPGTPVRILQRDNDWLYIQVPGGLPMWVYGRYLDGDSGPATVIAPDVRARPLPSTASRSYPIGTFLEGDAVEVLEVQGEWKRVRAPERLGAWVRTQDVVPGSIAQTEVSPSTSTPGGANNDTAKGALVTRSRIGQGGAKIYPYYRDSLPVLGELSPDSEVWLVFRQGDWMYVQVPGGLEVWVYGRYVDGDGGPGIINAEDVRARPLPSTARNSYPLGTFEQGEPVEVLEVQGRWKKVRAPERLGAWLKARDVVSPENQES